MNLRRGPRGSRQVLRPPPWDATGDAAIGGVADDEGGCVVQRLDGFYWIALDGRRGFGPFETLEQAQADMFNATAEDASQSVEALREAKREIGIAEWIDPETGEPAQGLSPPRLGDE